MRFLQVAHRLGAVGQHIGEQSLTFGRTGLRRRARPFHRGLEIRISRCIDGLNSRSARRHRRVNRPFACPPCRARKVQPAPSALRHSHARRRALANAHPPFGSAARPRLRDSSRNAVLCLGMPALAARVSSGNAAANFSCSISWIARRRHGRWRTKPDQPIHKHKSNSLIVTAARDARNLAITARASPPWRLGIIKPRRYCKHRSLADLDVGSHRHAGYHAKADRHVMQRHAIDGDAGCGRRARCVVGTGTALVGCAPRFAP